MDSRCSHGTLAAGVLYAQTWLLIFGAIFLGEELYETGVLSLALHWGSQGETLRLRCKGRPEGR